MRKVKNTTEMNKQIIAWQFRHKTYTIVAIAFWLTAFLLILKWGGAL